MKATIADTRTIELRKNTRFYLSAPARFYWRTPNGFPQRGEGTTRDIEKTGAYITTRQLPPLGALVQMDVTLPSLAGGGPGIHLTGEGIVIRVDPHDGKSTDPCAAGFAVSMHFHLGSSDSVLLHLKTSGRVM